MPNDERRVLRPSFMNYILDESSTLREWTNEYYNRPFPINNSENIARTNIENGRTEEINPYASFVRREAYIPLTAEFERKYIKCSKCGNKVEERKTIAGKDGNYYCEKCLEKARCSHCGELDYKFNLKNVDRYGYFCYKCFQEVFTTCRHCGTLIPKLKSIKINNIRTICRDCLQYYVECQDCGKKILKPGASFRDEAYVYDNLILCRACRDKRVPIKRYSYKPSPIFNKGKNDINEKMFFGVELEIENDNIRYDPEDEETDEYLEERAKEITSDLFYCKHDSSIECGFEIVSHPFSWNWLKENKKIFENLLSKLKENDFVSYDINTCGLHVHISRDAFNNKSLHLYKFLKLFYDFKGKTISIAGRQSSNYADISDNITIFSKVINKIGCQTDYFGRHQAVNIENRDTIEVRIFKGTLCPASFFRAIEYCHAAVMFTKNASVSFKWEDFINFIEKNSKKYKNLYNWTIKKNWIQKKEGKKQCV